MTRIVPAVTNNSVQKDAVTGAIFGAPNKRHIQEYCPQKEVIDKNKAYHVITTW